MLFVILLRQFIHNMVMGFHLRKKANLWDEK